MNADTTLSLADLHRDPERLLWQAELALLIDKSEAWLERHRWAKTGPRFVKIGRTPMYRARDVIEYLDQRTVDTKAA